MLDALLHESSIVWLFDNINKMLGLRRKPAAALDIPTLQLKEMISNKFHKLVNEHIINEAQEELVASYATALKRDCLREEAIKEQLNNQFFNVHKNRKRKYYLQEKLTANENAHLEMRQRLSKEFKRSINGKEAKRSSLHSPNLSARYEQTLTPSTASHRRRISYTPSLEGRSSVFSCQIDSIIESAQRVDVKPSRFKRDVVTATERQRLMQRTDHNQKEEIIEKIIEKDVDDFIKYSSVPAQHCSPEERKRFYEEVKMKELSNFDKYNMSFVSYMRQKTHNNIEKSIYNEKVRKKETYVEKFQKFILTEFKFSEEAKRRLEKIFKSIELEYKRPSKNREFSERVPK